MKKIILTIVTLSLMAFMANAQEIDKSKIKCFMAFEDSVTDDSGNGVTFTLTQGNPLTYELGKFGNAAIFDHNSLLSSGLTFNPGEGFTICAWIKHYTLPSEVSRDNVWIHQLDDSEASGGRIHLNVNTRNTTTDASIINCISSFTDGIRCDNTDSITKDKWYHVANVRRTDGSRSLYVDGVEVATVEGGTENNNNQIVIGSNKQQNNSWAYGTLDDLLITSEILTPAQIAYIKENGVASAIGIVSGINKTEILSGINAYYTNNQLSIENNSSAATAMVKVYTLAGQQIIVKNINLVAGKSSMDFKVENGIYLVQIQINQEVKTVKVIKK